MELKTKKGHFVVCTQVASLPTVVLATDLDLFCKQYIHQGSRRKRRGENRKKKKEEEEEDGD